MIELPRALAPWRSLLGLLPHDVALGLGTVVRRLALALGPLRARSPTRAGEPDGFDGLSRRGRYDRLLLSEWLLATEAPLEFTRRAAAGELAFLELARRAPARPRASIALFDAGPDQLGAPRVVQIAALLVLARRAEEAGAAFLWGVLQAPEAPAAGCAVAADVEAFVRARTGEPATSVHVDAWRARIGALGAEEVWFVGPPRLASAAEEAGAASLALEEVVDPSARAVHAAVRHPAGGGRRAAEVTLELPAADVAIRLLRDPLGVARAPSRRVAARGAPVSNLVFAANGRKLFSRAKGGLVVAVPIPNSPRAGAGRPKLYRAKHALAGDPGAAIAAIGWYRRTAILASVTSRGARIEPIGAAPHPELDREYRWPEGIAPIASGPDTPLTPLVMVDYGPRPVPMLLDAEGRLFELGSSSDPPVELVAEHVLAFAPANPGGFAFVGRGPVAREGRSSPPAFLPEGRWALVRGSAHRSVPPPTVEPLEGQAPLTAFFGHRDVTAIERAPGVWTTHSRGAVTELRPGGDVEVVGVVMARDEPNLVVLEGDRSLLLLGRSFSQVLPPSPEPIREVATSVAEPDIAFSTESGRIVVHSLRHGAPLLDISPMPREDA